MNAMNRRQRIKALKEAGSKRGKCTGCCCCNHAKKASNDIVIREINNQMFGKPGNPGGPDDFGPRGQVKQTRY